MSRWCFTLFVAGASRDQRRRHQFRWLALGAGLLPVTLLGTWLSYALIGNADVVLGVGLTVTYIALPTLVAVAICRPDLFDVDCALAATVVSSILGTGLLTLFTVTNVLAGIVLSRRAPAVAVAVTAVAAVLLVPAARRLRTAVDARLYPARHAALAAVDALQRETLQAAARPEDLHDRLREALHDPDPGRGYRDRAEGLMVDADGTPLGTRRLHGRRPRRAEHRSRLRSAPRSHRSSPALIAARAAPLVELVRLRLELRQALLAAEDSRARLLRAGYEERVRLERDLHDGAQQRLVALGMALRLAQRRKSRGVDVARSAGRRSSRARHGGERAAPAGARHPAELPGRRTRPALSSWSARPRSRSRCRVTAGELDSDVETTAYYVAARVDHECRQARRRHSTSHCRWSRSTGSCTCASAMTAAGGPRRGPGRASPGSPTGSAPRAVQLRVDSHPGIGTVIEAVLPCAS